MGYAICNSALAIIGNWDFQTESPFSSLEATNPSTLSLHRTLRFVARIVTNITRVSLQRVVVKASVFGNGGSQNIKTLLRLRRNDMKAAARNIIINALIAMVSLSTALGQGAPKLSITMEDRKFNVTVSEKTDSSSISYVPGDTIQYSITATNKGDGIMTNPVIVDPIPAGVTYVEQSAKGDYSEISFSLDQGNTYMAWPPFYTVRNSKGLLVKREASPDMITHIKWDISLELKPKESSMLEFLVVVNKLIATLIIKPIPDWNHKI